MRVPPRTPFVAASPPPPLRPTLPLRARLCARLRVWLLALPWGARRHAVWMCCWVILLYRDDPAAYLAKVRENAAKCRDVEI